ncbi:hypothetical protein [Jiangella sp. DSM 45060]|uniref:hypothetical protein n=1 Tax=Jiangella sp. DSM 45060 TaxID=1798224 RepID=UPI00087D7627|nr:hypothetical protein [Jiangella sp. DSM 45060]SDT35513.1 hypothetical protein SAMN04515669_3686 [Jiangella sp. DSM 45060]
MAKHINTADTFDADAYYESCWGGKPVLSWTECLAMLPADERAAHGSEDDGELAQIMASIREMEAELDSMNAEIAAIERSRAAV